MKKYIGILIMTLCLAFVGQSAGSLLIDSDFETNNVNVGWGLRDVDAALVAETGPNSAGGDSLCMGVTVVGSYAQTVSKAIPIVSGQAFDLTLDYKQLAGGTGDVQVQVRFWNGIDPSGYNESPSTGATFLGQHTRTLSQSFGAWSTYNSGTLPNTWPTADYVDFRVVCNAFTPMTGTVYADNINLITVPSTSLLANPGFEIEGAGGSTDADGWFQTNTNIVQRNGPVSEAGHGDWRMLFMDNVAALHWASQTLAATPGDTYTATADFQAVLESGEVAFIWLGFLDSGGGEISTAFTTYGTLQGDYADNVWVSRSVLAVAPAGTTQVSVRAMSSLNGNGNSLILADNVLLELLAPSDGAVTNATITVIPVGDLHGDSGDLFQNATITANAPVHPTRNIADLFSAGSPLGPEDMIFADLNSDLLSFVEFNIASAVSLTNITIRTHNAETIGGPDLRSMVNIVVYAGLTPETVLDNQIAFITLDPEYTDAYGGNFLKLSIDIPSVSGQYYRMEFYEPPPPYLDRGPRVWEIDGYGEPYVEPLYPPAILSWSPSSPGIMRMVVDAPSSADRYSPLSRMDLVTGSGSWGSVAHSDDGVHPFILTNLSYSTAEGTNEVIYVETADPVEFFRIIGE